MNLKAFFGAIFFLCLSATVFAVGDDKLPPAKAAPAMDQLLSQPLYTVETDEQSAAESLDRISGHFDNGFAPPDRVYKSKNQYHDGPQGLEKAQMQQQS